jgi:hypothetical protein
MAEVKPLPTREEIAEWYHRQTNNVWKPFMGKYDAEAHAQESRIISRAANHALTLTVPLVGCFMAERDENGVLSIMNVSLGRNTLDLLRDAYDWAEYERDVHVWVMDAREESINIREGGTPHFSPLQALEALQEGKNQIGPWAIDWNYKPGDTEKHDGTPITWPLEGQSNWYFHSSDREVKETTTWEKLDHDNIWGGRL